MKGTISVWFLLITMGSSMLIAALPQTARAAAEISTTEVENSAQSAIKDSTKKTVEETAQEAAQKAVQQATEKAVEKAAQQAAEKAAVKAAQSAAETAAARAVKKAAEEAAEKAEQKAKRPDEWRGPTKVHFLVFVVDIDSIEDANQSFSANVYIRLRWQDRRLATEAGSARQIPLDQVWNPRVVLVNQSGLVSRALPEVVHVEPDGTVLYYQRYTGKLSQPLNLSDFPLDAHSFTIQFVAAGYTADDLEFAPEVARGIVGGSMAKELSLPDWKVVKYEALALPYRPIEQVRAASFAFRFEAARFVAYYVWQVVLPLAVVVFMSWAAFWIGRDNVGVRIGVATSSILTLIAQRFVLSNLLPRLPYMTRLDYFTVGSTLLVFIALLLVVLSSYLGDHNKNEKAARRIDWSARVVFPTAFLSLLVWFVFG